MKLAYRLHWGQSTVAPPAGIREVKASRTSSGSAAGRRKWVIDFGPVRGKAAKPSNAPLEAVISAPGAKILGPIAHLNEVTGGLRVVFELAPEGQGPLELRAYVKSGSETLTETWSYLWTP